MNNFIQILKKHRFLIIFSAVIFVGIFLRVYNFSDWLFFQGDQVRDLLVARKAIEGGPGWLPLLGPKAGGTFLRLGPVFYYFQYIAASVFGLDPASMAFPDLFFSVLTLPLLFLFLRKFFSKNWSLALMAGYATCFFAVQYSRFAWNPNSLPFFNLLFFYSILKFLETGDARKKWLWSLAIGIAYAVASQLHFVSFLSLPIALILIFVLQKIILDKFEIKPLLKLAFVMLAVLAIFYIPVILSEISTGWNNSSNFLASIGKKSSDGSSLSLIKQNIYNFSKYFLIIWSGIIAIPKKIGWLFGTLFFSSAAVSLILIILKNRLGRKEILFLILIFSWTFSYFITYLPTANDLQPRHFLVIAPLPFVFWGIIGLALKNFFPVKYANFAAAMFLFVPIAANAYSVKTWFSEISASQIEVTAPRKSGLLKSVGGESWWHLKKTGEFMRGDCEKEELSIFPPKQAYRGLVDYSMRYAGESREYHVGWNSARYDSDTCYYAVNFSRNDYNDRFGGDVDEVRSVTFGDIRVIRFEIDQNEINDKKEIRNPFRKEKDVSPNKNTKDNNDDKPESDDESIGDEDSNPDGSAGEDIEKESGTIFNINLGEAKRKNRVFWKDLWTKN